MRIGVRADADVDAATQVCAEGAKRDSSAHEHGGAVRHAHLVLREQVEVSARSPVQPGVVVQEDGVPYHAALAERPDRVQETDRRLAVSALHLVELGHALGDVGLPRQCVLFGVVVGVAQQIGSAGVDLGGVHHAAESPAGMLAGALDEAPRLVEALASGARRPFVLERVAVPGEPARIAEARGDHRPNAARGEKVQPLVVGSGEVGNRGAAREQQLRHRHLEAGDPSLRIGVEHGQELV